MDEREVFIRFIERTNTLIDAATKIGVAYMGYKAAKHPAGALTALVALKLAEGGNIVGGAAGIGVLTIIGLTQLVPAPGVPVSLGGF